MSILTDMPEAEYHAHPALSSTEARLLLESPAKYRWKKDNPPLIGPSTKFDIGSAVHTKVLGRGYGVVVIDAADWRTKAAQAARDDARAAGQIPVLKHEYDLVSAAAESVLRHPTAALLLERAGDPEVSVFATDPATQVDVRARFDFLPEATDRRRVAVDVKTTIDASPDGFEKSVANYGYDVQRAWYLDALALATGEADAEMVFVAVEKEPPYLVAVHQLSTQWAEMGHTKARRAREVFAECAATGDWPGYPPEVHLLSAPNWELYRFAEKYES